MDIKNLETFIEVAELSSFTKAAQKLGYSQSTVSFQIRQLESSLGTQLFERINHTIALTDRGREALGYAHQISKLARDMERRARQEHEISGVVRIAMAESLCNWLLEGQFAALRREYPGITLKIIAASTEEMFRLLNQNEVDLVYTLDSHIYHRDYIIAGEEKISSHFVAAADDPLLRIEDLTLEHLMDQPFILTEKGMSYRRLMEEQLARRNMEIDPVLEIGNTGLICRLVEQGMGISFLPDYVTDTSVAAGRMVRLEVESFTIEIWKQLLYHRDKWVSRQMQTVMEFFTEQRS